MPNEQLPVEYDPSSGIPLTPLTLPVDDAPKPYVMASDLVGTQQQEQSLPVGYALNDAGIPFNIKTGKEDLPIIRRPSVLPIAKTPDGYTLAMPKVLDAVGSVMGPLAAGKVPLAAGEALLGSGAVRTAKELAEGNPFTIDAFHGTNQPIIKFNKTKSNLNDESATRSTTSDLGTWFTDTPKIAENYAENAAKNLIPNYTAHKKEYDRLQKEVERTEKIKDWKANEKAIEALENHELGALQEPPSGQNIMPVKLALKKPLEIDAKGGTMNDVDKTHGDVRQLIIDAKKDGYDGVVFKNLNDNPASHEIGTHYVVFDPANVRSKFAKFDPAKYDKNGLFFSDTRPQVASALARSLDKQNNAPAFYSGLEKAVETAKPTIATADQWLGYLKNQPGVKSEELATVLKELPSGPITKEALGDIVKTNKVELGEVVKGIKDTELEQWKVIRKDGHVDSTWTNKESASKQAEKIEGSVKEAHETKPMDDTKFSQYQLPGGENYKEMLLTLPKSEAGLVAKPEGTKGAWNVYDKSGNKIAENLNPTMSEKEAIAFSTRHSNDQFKSSHWDEPNVLAHIRMNDRNVDGSKTLHLEEIQSDWHQKGRKEGYKLDPKEKARLDTNAESVDNKLTAANAEDIMGNPDLDAGLKQAVERKILSQKEADDYKYLVKNENGTISDAPFKKNWDELALKKMIHKAASEGYEGISWTPGEAQAARYDLSKQVENIQWKPEHGSRLVEINPKGGKQIGVYVNKEGKVIPNEGYDVHAKPYEGKPLADIVGKEIAEKIMTGDKGNLSGEGLKIGGEGMKSFYDKMLVDKANALAKKYGSNVEQKELSINSKVMKANPGDWRVIGEDGKGLKRENGEPYSFDSQKDAEDFAKINVKGPSIHYLSLTPELKKKALQDGFPLFSSSPILNPVDFDPFKDEKKKFKLVPVQGNPFQ